MTDEKVAAVLVELEKAIETAVDKAGAGAVDAPEAARYVADLQALYGLAHHRLEFEKMKAAPAPGPVVPVLEQPGDTATAADLGISVAVLLARRTAGINDDGTPKP